MNRQEHLLTIIAEECAEVAKCTSKSIRFGLYSRGELGLDKTNLEKLKEEFNDLVASVELLEDELEIDIKQDLELKENKKQKIQKFLKYSENLGTLTNG